MKYREGCMAARGALADLSRWAKQFARPLPRTCLDAVIDASPYCNKNQNSALIKQLKRKPSRVL